ncbi:MAG: FAD-dependent oxidoreductase [Bacillota bacterium]|nr:FAD-dependent oxidoreductase [Bacillota bacterium]
MFKKLFSPIKIRGMELKNRIILPAMGTKFSGNDCYVTDQLKDYHEARAKGGTGLSIVEVCSVYEPAAPRGFLSIAEDKYIEGLKELTDVIHTAGGKVGLQLWQGSIAVGMDPTALMLVASDMPVSPEITIPGMTIEQIKEVVAAYGAAAKRAVKAGFDCVEIHMAHNYLPHSFLSGGINRREDEYGGSFENRARFPLEVIRAVRENIPEDMPLFIRIGAHDDYLENGLTIEEVIDFCKLAKEEGVDVLDVSRGNIISPAIKYEVPPIDIEQGFNIDNAARIRKETGMLTIGVGRINTPELAEEILQEDKVDLVVMGRAQIADPEFSNKAKAGNLEDIVYCVGCNQGCFDGFANLDSPYITCLRNPAVGREAQYKIEMTENPVTLLITGGGIAGLEAAIVSRQRGHNVILCEASDKLGGQFYTAGLAPRKEEMKDAVLGMVDRAERLGVEIRLNTKVTPELIEEIEPHSFFNAIGATPFIPPIPGVDLPDVVNAHDVLNGKTELKGKTVIIGGGLVGMEAAEYLAEKGADVTVLEMLPEICGDLGDLRKICVNENVAKLDIKVETEVTVTEIKDGEVIGEKDGESVSYASEFFVIAVGSKSRDGGELEAVCHKKGIGYFVIGDSVLARKALDATKEAMEAALTFDDPEVHARAAKPKKVVVMTGATGIMGQETLKQLLSRADRFKTRILVRPSEKNKTLLKKYICPALEVVWGDMTDYETVLKCVTGADYVLHIGAMVSPMSDKEPEKTLYTNIGSTLNFIKAIKAQPDPDKVHYAIVTSVAMLGGRTEPIHWGRVGDPINPSIFDYYGMSKVFSELALFESRLKHWVSIRQTGQHPTNEAGAEEPIAFHQPVNNVLEWSTSIESGICMANLCEDWVPEDFWRKAYNLSSGAGYRLASWELYDIQLGAFGIGIKDLFDAEMLALYNFHGHYYSDGHLLDDMLHFRCIPAEQYWGGVEDEMRRMAANPMIKAGFPTGEEMKANMIKNGHKPGGTYWMFNNNKEDWIRAFFGSRENQKAIPSFEDGFELSHPSEEETRLDHGYDEEKGLENLSLEDLQKAAKFRGGKCLLAKKPEDIYTPVEWECADGHRFEMSVNAVLHGGHWCPECIRSTWHYGEIAKKNPFYAQVWFPIHGEDEDYVIDMEFSAYEIYHELKNKLEL